MSRIYILVGCFCTLIALSQSYPPEAGMPGSTAIHKNSSLFIEWANGIVVERGYINKSNPDAIANGSHYASSGNDNDALGFPNGDVVSLGDGGSAILTFINPIVDRQGFDFAVFENGIVGYLELAFVEVSSDGIHFFRFPNHSQTQTEIQIDIFGTPVASYLNNLAGKYTAEYGTPFDISELSDNEFLDKNNIRYVKIIDVVGSINPDYASYDSFGNAVNDSFPTPFNSCGFDLQAVGVINNTLDSSDFLEAGKVCLYPNPAKTQFYITNIDNAMITLIDVNGRILSKKQNIGNQSVDVSDLKKGIYIVKVESGRASKQLKLIIER